MRHAVLLTLALFSPGLTQADGALAVAMPSFPDFTQTEYEDMLTDLVTANVVGMNCPGFEISDGEWALITGAADLIANNALELDTAAYDAAYYGPAFALLDKPETCAVEGPKIKPLVKVLIRFGGSTTPN